MSKSNKIKNQSKSEKFANQLEYDERNDYYRVDIDQYESFFKNSPKHLPNFLNVENNQHQLATINGLPQNLENPLYQASFKARDDDDLYCLVYQMFPAITGALLSLSDITRNDETSRLCINLTMIGVGIGFTVNPWLRGNAFLGIYLWKDKIIYSHFPEKYSPYEGLYSFLTIVNKYYYIAQCIVTIHRMHRKIERIESNYF